MKIPLAALQHHSGYKIIDGSTCFFMESIVYYMLDTDN